MQFTYRNPARSTDPARILAGARSIVAGAWATDARHRRRRLPAADAWRATCGVTTTRRSVTRWAQSPTVLRDAGFEARVLADDNALVDRAVGAPSRARLVRQERQRARARSRFMGGARLGRHHRVAGARRPSRSPTDVARCQKCIDGCPTDAIVAPGVVDAAPMPGVAGAGTGNVPGRVSRRPRRPHLRVRRLPGGVPAVAGPRHGTPSPNLAAITTLGPRPICSRCCAASDSRTSRAPRALVHRAPRPPLPAPQCPDRARQQPPTPTTSRSWRRCRHASTATTRCWPSTRDGRRTDCGATGGGVSHLLVTNDFPPKMGGIQNYLWELWRRLPDGRAHVLTTSHDRSRRLRRRAAVPDRTRRLGAAADAGGAASHQARRVARPTRDLVVLDPVLPIGVLGRHVGVPYSVIVHGAELAIPARTPGVREIGAIDPARGPR